MNLFILIPFHPSTCIFFHSLDQSFSSCSFIPSSLVAYLHNSIRSPNPSAIHCSHRPIFNAISRRRNICLLKFAFGMLTELFLLLFKNSFTKQSELLTETTTALSLTNFQRLDTQALQIITHSRCFSMQFLFCIHNFNAPRCPT